MIHRLETNKLRNIAKFFAHLLHSNGLGWGTLEYIVVTEEETTALKELQLYAIMLQLKGFRHRVKEFDG